MKQEEDIEIDEKGLKKLDEIRIRLKEAIDIDKSNPDRDILIKSIMLDLYQFFSNYPEKLLNKYVYIFEIYKIERMLSEEFIDIDSKPDFNENDFLVYPEKRLSKEDSINAAKFLVFLTRRRLSGGDGLENDSLEKRCIISSSYVRNFCIDLNIDYVSFNVSQDLTKGYYHCFTIIKFPLKNGEVKKYLVDCTYRQFFTKSDSFIERIEVMRGLAKGASIGAYMTMTEDRKRIAEELLKNGFIEATPENLKAYFDAIIFSARDKHFYKSNGLDYMNPDDCIPNYTINDYMNMLIKNKTIKQKSIEEAVNEIVSGKQKKEDKLHD